MLERDPSRDWLIDQSWKLKNGDKVPSSLKGCSEVVNDINLELTDFWRCLADTGEFSEFMRIAQCIPFSEYEWKATIEAGGEFIRGRVARAVAFFIRCRQSLSGRMKNFASLTRNRTRRGMNEQASAWLSVIDGLPAVHERFKSVIILSRDALEVIRGQDGENTLFYCDPTYLPETRATTGEYEHEMTRDQHEELLKLLATIKGKFMLSGYDSELYRSFALIHRWNLHTFDLPNNSAGGKSKRRMTECLWVNY